MDINNIKTTQNIKEPRDIKCLNEQFDKSLVESKKAKNLAEASSIPRMLYCPCSNCNRIKF